MNISAYLSRLLCSCLLTLVLCPARVLLADGTPPVARVGIEASIPATSEPNPLAFIRPGEFSVWRQEGLDTELTVYLAYGGTASALDYQALPEKVVIRPGEASVKILVLANSDLLLEGTETVVAKIVPAPPEAPFYQIADNAASAEIRIGDEDSSAGLPVVRIRTVRGETAEPSPLSRVAPGEFVLTRDGAVDEELTVFLSFEGTATPGVDYDLEGRTVRFPAGAAEVKLLIVAVDDSLVEGTETVLIQLVDPPTDGLPYYTIDAEASTAKLLIHDSNSEGDAVIRITSPLNGARLPAGMDVEINAVAVDPEGYIATLEFYLDGSLLDTSVITFIRAPDPGTPIHHTVLWKSPSPGKHELVARGKDSRGVIVSSEPVIVEVTERIGDTLVSIVATDPEGTELPLAVSSIDPLEFEITRTGPTGGALIVFFSLHGTASQEDYFEVPTSVIIPDGSASAKFQIVPKADPLAVMEPTETVVVRLEPSPLAGPMRTYGIDPAQAEAGGVIYEGRRPENGMVELILPIPGEGFEFGQSIRILAASSLGLSSVDFYDRDAKIGSSALVADSADSSGIKVHSFVWRGARAGEHILSARATLSDGEEIVSQGVMVVVKDSGASQAYIKITEPGDGQTFPAGAIIPITAVAVDPEGYIPRVEFFANERQIGVSEIAFFQAPDPGTPITHTFTWENVPAGDYLLTVRGVDSHGQEVISFPVKISVGGGGGGERATIEIVSPKSGDNFEAGLDIPITAVAIDPKGYISRVEFYANGERIGVSEIVFIRAPDPGTPITHTFIWIQAPAGEYSLTARAIDAEGNTITSPEVKIRVGQGEGLGQVVIDLEPIDPFAAETTDNGKPDAAVFLIRRIGGLKEIAVPVYLKLSGSAINGVDYAELKDVVVLPAGASSVEVVIQPLQDGITEGEETVELTIVEPVCPAIFPPPPQCYLTGKLRTARALIRDHAAVGDELEPKVAIVPPSDSSKIERGQPLEIRAEATAVRGKACLLESSTDLKTWSAVGPVYLPDGQLSYVIETGTESHRYYRLKVD